MLITLLINQFISIQTAFLNTKCFFHFLPCAKGVINFKKIQIKKHILNVNYFAIKTFSKSFVVIVTLASYLSIGAFSLKSSTFNNSKRKKVRHSFTHQFLC